MIAEGVDQLLPSAIETMCKEKRDGVERQRATRYIVLSDLTDDLSSLEEFALRCEGLAEKARKLADAGFELAVAQDDRHALAMYGHDQSLADDLGLAE